jgi:hypothetical protein
VFFSVCEGIPSSPLGQCFEDSISWFFLIESRKIANISVPVNPVITRMEEHPAGKLLLLLNHAVGAGFIQMRWAEKKNTEKAREP